MSVSPVFWLAIVVVLIVGVALLVRTIWRVLLELFRSARQG